MSRRRQNRATLSPRRSRRSLFISSLLLAAILFLVIAFITFRQLRAAEANRMRLLAGFAGQVEATVLDLVQRYVNVVDQEQATALVRERLREVPNVSLVAGPLTTEQTSRRLDLEARGPRIYLHFDTLVPVDVKRDVESARPAALESPSTTSDDASDESSPASIGPGDDPPPDTDSTEVMRLYTGLLDLPDAVRPMVIPEAFDLVVLARRGVRQAGLDATTEATEPFTVLFQQGAGELKLADARAAWEVRAPGVWRSLKEAWSEGSDPEPTGGGSRVVETRIAGTDYRVFIQPLTLHLRDTEGNPLGPPQEWIACGLISWENLLSASFTTSPLLLFLMVALIPVMLVAWPFLKLWLISSRQAFTRFDAAFLVLSILVGLSLAALLVLDGAFLGRLEATVDDQLRRLSGELKDALYAELDAAAAVLKEVGDDSDRWRVRAPRLQTLLEPNAGAAGPADPVLVREVLKTFRYPFLHALIWIDGAGEQVEKIPFHRDSVLRNRVQDRGYFRCHREEDGPDFAAAEGLTAVFAPADGPRDDESRICLQSIRSKTTAGDLAALSVAAPGPEAGRAAAETPTVLALTTRLVSLNRALLAPGFSFAVVDRAGAVAFHSDPRRNANEDFVKATGDDPVLAALLAEGREGPLDIHYWGSRYRARVLPLERLPWSLITLRTTRDLRTRNFELIYDFLNLLLPYTIFLGLVLLLGIRYLPAAGLRPMLPSRAFTPVYRQLVLASPVALGLFALLLASGWPPLILLAAACLPQLILLGVAVRGFRELEPWPHFTSEPKDPAIGLARLRSWSTLSEPSAREWSVLGTGVAAALFAALAGGQEPIRWVLLLAAVGLAAAFVLLYRTFLDRTTVAPYSAALAVALLALAVLPAVGFFRLAESRQTQLLVQDAEVGLLRHEQRRRAALPGDRGELWSALLGGAEALPELEPFRDRLRAFADGTARAFFEADLLRAVDNPCDPEDADGALWPYGRGQEHDSLGWSMRAVSRLLSSRPFPLNDLTADPVGTDLSRFHHHGVRWSLEPGCAASAPAATPGTGSGEPRSGQRLRAEWTAPLAPGSPGDEPVVAVSTLFDRRGLPGELSALPTTLLILAFPALALMVVGSAAFLARKIALIAVAPNRGYAAIDKLLDQVCYNGRRAQRFLVRTSLPAAIEQTARGEPFADRLHILSFGMLWSADAAEREAAFFGPLDKELEVWNVQKLLPFKPRALLIVDFRPDLSKLEETDAKIELLRRLERRGVPGDDPELHGRSMLIVTSRPYHLLGRFDPGSDRHDDAEARSRWHAYFARFSQRLARDEGKSAMFESWIEWQRKWLGAGHWPQAARLPSGETGRTRAFLEPDWFRGADGEVWRDPDYDRNRPHPREEVGVLKPYREIFVEPPPRKPRDWQMRRLDYLLGVLLEECRWTWRLQRVALDVHRELVEEFRAGLRVQEAAAASAGEPASGAPGGPPGPPAEAPAMRRWEPPTARQLVNRVGLAAQPYYERVWDGCEEGEKRVLHQLAVNGVVNPKAFDVVLDLLNKGLVVRTSDNPVLRLVNQSFGQFVRRTVRRSEAWRWEEEEGLSAWEIWKWVLPIPLLLLGAFLFMTQQDALSNVVGLVVALASLVPTGVNLYQHFQHLAAEREATGA